MCFIFLLGILFSENKRTSASNETRKSIKSSNFDASAITAIFMIKSMIAETLGALKGKILYFERILFENTQHNYKKNSPSI